MTFKIVSQSEYLINDRKAVLEDFGHIVDGRFVPDENLKPIAIEKFGLRESAYYMIIEEIVALNNEV